MIKDRFNSAEGYTPIESPAQIVEEDWEYGFDYWDGPCNHKYECNHWSVLEHCPEWIGKSTKECVSDITAFRIPIQRKLPLGAF